MTETIDAWFKQEILSHEDMLVRFIARVWPHRDEIADIRQESYVRVYEAARRNRPQSPKAFLFATARHLMADRVRRERIVSIRTGVDMEFLNVLADEISPEQRVSAHQELARLAQAFDCLSAKCREVVWLRRVKELSQKEVAHRLGLAEKTIEKHLRTGVRLLARYTRENALVPHARRSSRLQDLDVARDPSLIVRWMAQQGVGHERSGNQGHRDSFRRHDRPARGAVADTDRCAPGGLLGDHAERSDLRQHSFDGGGRSPQ